ncbi:hypothetical protein H1R20_g3530, partial [Candolleomyces eurysporus]
MTSINSVKVSPALLNSSCAWSSNLRDLQELYDSPYTGAITTRTATLAGFKEDESHTVVLGGSNTSALNSYGYSPHPLTEYLVWVRQILERSEADKPIIISITSSTPDGLRSMVTSIQDLRKEIGDTSRSPSRIAIELNTSCPNIRNASPSGYSFKSLTPLLQVLSEEFSADKTLTIGLKMPPYVYREQFTDALEVLAALSIQPESDTTPSSAISPISFLTCTNTLGNSLLFSHQIPTSPNTLGEFALPTVVGGLSGDSIHPLALGNVYTFSQLLRGPDARFPTLSNIRIIGVGGVTSKQARERMLSVGADAVACATLFGKEGVQAFEILSTSE